jgi:hypothetical protein
MASGAAPSTSPGPTRAPTAVAAFATGAVPLSDVVDHPREGPPGRTPPPPPFLGVVVHRVPRRPQCARLGDEKPTAAKAVGSNAVSFVVVHGEGADVGEDGGGRRFSRRG